MIDFVRGVVLGVDRDNRSIRTKLEGSDTEIDVPYLGDAPWPMALVLLIDDVTPLCVGSIGDRRSVLHDDFTIGLNNASEFQAAIIDVQVFTANGTWTKPTGPYKLCQITCIGGGGGGGSGRRGGPVSNRCGGGGGGGGARTLVTHPFSVLSSSYSVTVGAGGPGGAAKTTDNTDGSPGTNGGQTYFGTVGDILAFANRGVLGGSGTNATGTGGTGGGGQELGGFGSSADLTGPAADGQSTGEVLASSVPGMAAAGGGAGGSLDNAGIRRLAGGGGDHNTTLKGGGASGGAAGANGADGGDQPANSPIGGPGGAGGEAGANAGGAAGAGGAGGNYGGGGGGGGASSNGSNSGAGGPGGDGLMVVVCS